MSLDLHTFVQGLNTTVETVTTQNAGTYTTTEDANTNTRLVEYDRNNDGKVDDMSLFYEDQEGKVIKGAYDLDGDGKADKYSLFQYDDDGKMTERYDDVNGDNVFDSYVEFSYDENGNRIESDPKEIGKRDWRRISLGSRSDNIDMNVFYKQLSELSKQRIGLQRDIALIKQNLDENINKAPLKSE